MSRRLRKSSCLAPSILVSLILIVPTTTSAETIFYVAPDGDDQNDGTTNSPFATPARAQLAVRDHIARGLSENLIVEFRSGVYPQIETLTFGVDDGGNEQFSVVWKAAQGERAVLTGGRPITEWSEVEPGLWKAPISDIDREWEFRELFVNGRRRLRARHPNDRFLRASPLGSEQRTAFRTTPGSFPALTNPFNAELVFLHDWSISRIPLIQADSANGTIHLAAPVGAAQAQFALFNFEANPPFLLENDIAFLDSPGEWFLDVSNQTLLYRPLPGESLDSISVIAPIAPGLISVRGDDRTGRPVRNLHFKGLQFEHTAWQRPTAGYAGIQATFYEVRAAGQAQKSEGPVPAAVIFELAERCSFTDGSIRNVGGSGIAFGSQCRGCELARSVIKEISANGVIIGEGTSRQVRTQPWWQSAPNQIAAGNAVRDCLIERCGAQFFGGVGVWAGITAGTVIERNLIRDLPYSGISVGWVWESTPTPARDNIVSSNRIERVMQMLSDGGGVYTLGNQPGMIIGGNVISSVPLAAGRAESNGMFLDEGSTGLTIESNTIFDIAAAPLRFHRTGANLVQGNVLVLSPGAPPVRYNNTPEDQIRLRGNTILSAGQFDRQQVPTLSGPRPEFLPLLESLARD